MVVGVVICAASYSYMRANPVHCHVKPESVVAGTLMYGSYLYLFVDFFVRRFVLGQGGQKQKPQQQQQVGKTKEL